MRPEPRTLELLPFGPLGDDVPLAEVGAELDRHFGTRSVVLEPAPLDPAWTDPESGAVRSGLVLDHLVERAEGRCGDPAACWTLAVVDGELAAPGLPWVFGEATVGGCCAVVGLARLRTGSRWRPGRFRRRLLVEAVHEMGHVAGLEHCPEPRCVMFASDDLPQTDRKGPAPCADCASRLRDLRKRFA